MELKHAASSTDATAGDLYALPSNASCLVANPRGSRGSRGEGRGGAGLKSRQFLTQTENISPSFTLSAALFNPGGLADFQGNAARVLSRHVTYEN